MFTKFWDKIAENLAGQWQLVMPAPGLAFWGGSLILFSTRHGWEALNNLIAGWNNAQGLAALAAALLLIFISTMLMNQFSLLLLRWLEGYWSGPFRSLFLLSIFYFCLLLY